VRFTRSSSIVRSKGPEGLASAQRGGSVQVRQGSSRLGAQHVATDSPSGGRHLAFLFVRVIIFLVFLFTKHEKKNLWWLSGDKISPWVAQKKRNQASQAAWVGFVCLFVCLFWDWLVKLVDGFLAL
jgi:hypothetical protein